MAHYQFIIPFARDIYQFQKLWYIPGKHEKLTIIF